MKVKSKNNGMLAVNNDITFIGYAKCLEKIKNTRSLNYHIKGKDNIGSLRHVLEVLIALLRVWLQKSLAQDGLPIVTLHKGGTYCFLRVGQMSHNT